MATSTQNCRSPAEVEIAAGFRLLQAVQAVVAVSTCSA
jgi:hypothetical protein